MDETQSKQKEKLTFSAGTIVNCRGREWIVLDGSTENDLYLRPVSGSEKEITQVYVPIENPKPRSASFTPPDISQLGNQTEAILLRDALMLSLRRGAGPFRSFGQIAVEPRSYQLVPLMMALKQETIRLLIADGVGIGKTIETGLILREMIDRGEVNRFAILCPPSIVDQWVEELKAKFNLQATAVTAANAARLERTLMSGQSIFKVYPYTVVSLDYIKSDAHRDAFVRTCPEFVIVDEVHACVSQGTSTIQRYALLKRLSEEPVCDDDEATFDVSKAKNDAQAQTKRLRHMLLLTATPHSGNDDAFDNLLALLNPDFAGFSRKEAAEQKELREKRLSQHIVLRTRKDLETYNDGSTKVFPKENKSLPHDITYAMNNNAKAFYDEVLNYCRSIVNDAGADEVRRHKSFFGTLAIMRCVSSSPAAALKALKTRAGLCDDAQNEARILDIGEDMSEIDDIEPAVEASPMLNSLIEKATKLCAGADAYHTDDKYVVVQKHIDTLLKKGFRPIIFCRYIATAEYLFDKLKSKYSGRKYTIDCVTGMQPPEERKDRIVKLEAAYDDGKTPILIATDCLSEGINLQNAFNAIIHYDLCWNPTRLEQREGRVNRIGQKSQEVHVSMVYGNNSAIDMTVLNVILKKAMVIKQNLGVSISLPDDSISIAQNIMQDLFKDDEGIKSAIESKRQVHARQLSLFEDFFELESDKFKILRSILSQGSLKPQEAMKEWDKSMQVMGSREDVQRFVNSVFQHLGATPEQIYHTPTTFKIPFAPLKSDLYDRFDAEGIQPNAKNELYVDYEFPGHANCLSIHRSHPLVSILAETVLERSLTDSSYLSFNKQMLQFGRVGVWKNATIESVTTLALLRLRFKLSVLGRHFLVEEACLYGWNKAGENLSEQQALELLKEPSAGDMPEILRSKQLNAAQDALNAKRSEIEQFAEQRADELQKDHKRIRKASKVKGAKFLLNNNKAAVKYEVEPHLPVDIIGFYVLIPVVR